jgi:hypothetical protein
VGFPLLSLADGHIQPCVVYGLSWQLANDDDTYLKLEASDLKRYIFEEESTT